MVSSVWIVINVHGTRSMKGFLQPSFMKIELTFGNLKENLNRRQIVKFEHGESEEKRWDFGCRFRGLVHGSSDT